MDVTEVIRVHTFVYSRRTNVEDFFILDQTPTVAVLRA